MNPSQFDESLKDLLRRRPFVPFEVALLDGKRIIVDRPDAVSVDGGSAGFIADDGTIHFFDSKVVQKLGTLNGVST